MLSFPILVAIAVAAKIEQFLAPDMLKSQRMWLKHYKFESSDSWFCNFCRSIPTECPTKRIGLPPMCKYNPLYDEVMLMQWKAADFAHQDDYIKMAESM